MSKERFEQWGYESLKDNKTGEIYDNYIDLINQQDQRIAELEEQLKDLQEKEKVISREFAIEQLRKVKEWVINYSDLKGQNWSHTLNYLNNQIKQLKEWE